MEAIVVDKFVTSYDELQPSHQPLPILEPGSSQVLIRIAHAGLNFVDLLYARGKHQNNRSLVRPPFTLGLEFAGTVEATGSSASQYHVGDAVFGAALGTFATHVVVDESLLRKVPESWSLKAAAGMAATAPVAYGALVNLAKMQAGETVLVHAAAGGLGCMAVQIAAARGARVLATVGSEAKRSIMASQLGVPSKDVVNYSVEGWEKRLLELTDNEGVDVVFDVVGLIEQSIRVCKYGARVVIVGFAGREGDLESIRANRILLRGIILMGYRYGESGRRNPGEHEAIWTGLDKLVSDGLVKPVVFGQRFEGLASVPRAMHAMAARQVWGKAIIDIAEKPPPSNL